MPYCRIMPKRHASRDNNRLRWTKPVENWTVHNLENNKRKNLAETLRSEKALRRVRKSCRRGPQSPEKIKMESSRRQDWLNATSRLIGQQVSQDSSKTHFHLQKHCLHRKQWESFEQQSFYWHQYLKDSEHSPTLQLYLDTHLHAAYRPGWSHHRNAPKPLHRMQAPEHQHDVKHARKSPQRSSAPECQEPTRIRRKRAPLISWVFIVLQCSLKNFWPIFFVPTLLQPDVNCWATCSGWRSVDIICSRIDVHQASNQEGESCKS